MNTKQKLTFLAALALASGAAYAMLAGTNEAPKPVPVKVSEAQDTRPVNTDETAKAEAERVERLKRMVEYRGDTPIVADYCWTNPSWPSLGNEHEMTCGLTRFRGYHEIYTAGWKVVTVVPGEIGPELVFIERIGAEQWKGQHVGYK